MSEHGFVLAGGLSSRLGRDKALLAWRGQTLVKRATALLSSLGMPVTVVIGGQQKSAAFGLPTIVDEISGKGPLGGLYTALRQGSAEFNFLLGCDLPLLPARLFERLRGEVEAADIVLPLDSTGRAHPLAAIYRKTCLPRVQERLPGNDLSLKALISDAELTVRVVSPAIHQVEDRRFLNVNTPEAWRRLQRHASD